MMCQSFKNVPLANQNFNRLKVKLMFKKWEFSCSHFKTKRIQMVNRFKVQSLTAQTLVAALSVADKEMGLHLAEAMLDIHTLHRFLALQHHLKSLVKNKTLSIKYNKIPITSTFSVVLHFRPKTKKDIPSNKFTKKPPTEKFSIQDL